nr:NepR family anti-sigma factor [uncultured Lichenicoccus sp.]
MSKPAGAPAMQPLRPPERFAVVMNNSSFSFCAPDRAASLFEGWLQSDLRRLYDRTLCEPVPDELLRLIAQAQEPDPTRS